MILLFNKNGTGGATEIKNLLGFTDADIKWNVFQNKIYTATDTIIELIGQDIYDYLVDVYLAATPDTLDSDFLRRVQYSICIDAYRNIAKHTDLAHTTNGRVNRSEDKQKLAWEWQIINSDRLLERDYYKSIDSLIKFMDIHIELWKQTDAYKNTFDLLIRTADEIDEYYNIDGSRLLLIKLMPGIRKAEREEIIPRITKERFDDLKTKLKDNANDIDYVLLKKIQEVLVYKALSWAIPRLSAQLFPEGFMQIGDNSRLTASARKSVEKTQAESYAAKFLNDADLASIQLESYIKSISASPILPENVLPISNNFNPEDNFVSC